MSQVWLSQPRFKIELNSAATTITDDQAIEIQVVRPENNISHAIITVNDYQSKNYVANFDPFVDVDISFRYGNGSYTNVFSGMINDANPTLSDRGEVLNVTAWGWDWALLKTHCPDNYGSESMFPSMNTPQEILQDIITNYVNKAFGSAGASTQWALDNSGIENVHNACNINYLGGAYLDNFALFNKLCNLVNAYAQDLAAPEVSIHWMVDTSKKVYVKKIDADSSDGAWDHYWGGTSGTNPGTQASSTIVVQQDQILYDFRKNIDEYANKIILTSGFRKPAYDIWNEDNGVTWGTSGCNYTYTNAQYVVGSHSLLIEPTAPNGGWSHCYYPSGVQAVKHWDFTKCGSPNSIPSLNLYWRANGTAPFNSNILLVTGVNINDYYQALPYNIMEPVTDKWVHLRLPIGPYWALDPSLQKHDASSNFEWTANGNPDWSNINWVIFAMVRDTTYDLYIDDLHFAGQIIREAKDTSEITATKKEHQKIIRCDSALDDNLDEGTLRTTDTGTAARLAYAELLRRSQTPIVGIIQVPGAPTMLPGQTLHIHAAKQSSGTYRIDSDMRIKELRHNYNSRGFITQLNLTSDVTNSNAFGVPSAYSLILEQAYGLTHGEAQDLKSSGIDPLIPRLSESY